MSQWVARSSLWGWKIQTETSIQKLIGDLQSGYLLLRSSHNVGIGRFISFCGRWYWIQWLCPGLVFAEFMFLFNIPTQSFQHTPRTFISVIQYIQYKYSRSPVGALNKQIRGSKIKNNGRVPISCRKWHQLHLWPEVAGNSSLQVELKGKYLLLR